MGRFNPLQSGVAFLNPLKTSENIRFFNGLKTANMLLFANKFEGLLLKGVVQVISSNANDTSFRHVPCSADVIQTWRVQVLIEMLKYTNADLKICQCILLPMKIINWRFHIKTPLLFEIFARGICERFVYKQYVKN